MKHVHLIGIGGTGISSIARVLLEKGYTVSGSDRSLSPLALDLKQAGVTVFEGHAAANIQGANLVVRSSAISDDNIEVTAARQAGIPVQKRAEFLNTLLNDYQTLAVAGSHGKTTTSALLAWVLQAAGLDPSFMIGGILPNFDSNYRLGRGPFFVVEGDEYDTAFFDKGPKFLHYRPAATVLTSIEFDHADIYRDLAHVKGAFRRLADGLPPGSLLVVCDEEPHIPEVIAGAALTVRHYGRREGSHWRLGPITAAPPWTTFDVLKAGGRFARFRTRLIGTHNLLNALAAIAVADHLGLSAAVLVDALETFEGIRRRQEIRGEKRGIVVMDDFAHHPTAVRETIAAVKTAFPGRRLIAVFEPRTNSSMRKVFQPVYPAAFACADMICIRRPPRLDKVPEAERFSSEDLVHELNRRGKTAGFFADTDRIIEHLAQTAAPGDVILVMSNGGFDNIHERLLASL